MAPTILVVGATGNTGKGVINTLPSLIKSSSLANHRILALTRSKSSSSAQKIAQIPGVELAEQNWIEITAEWLREHEVVRVFIASHNEPKHFAEEGQFLNEALTAGVKYVVRISTTAANVKPAFRAYYPRSHWAIEKMLEQPEYSAMHCMYELTCVYLPSERTGDHSSVCRSSSIRGCAHTQFLEMSLVLIRRNLGTSLQPNVFTTLIMAPSAEFIKKHRETKQQGTLSIMFDKDTGAAPIDPVEVGDLAAHLLVLEDTAKYNKRKLVLNGPEDISGSDIVQLVEGYIGEPVKDVQFRDVRFIDQWADSQTAEAKNLIRSIKAAPITAWTGEAQAATTSKEVLDLAAPKHTSADALKMLLEQ